MQHTIPAVLSSLESLDELDQNLQEGEIQIEVNNNGGDIR